MDVAVTGCTGFIGRYIVDRLLNSSHQVIGVARNPGKVPELGRRITIRPADLYDLDALRNAFAGCAYVVSNAADVSFKPFSKHIIHRSILATENVMNAASSAGVKRVILISSASIYRSYDRPPREIDPIRNSPPKVVMSAYPYAKAAAEEVSFRMAKASGIEMTSIRPMSVFGTFDDKTLWHHARKKLNKKRRAFVLGHLRTSPVYAGDIGNAVCMMLDRECTIGEAYNICGGHESSLNILNAWREAGGPTPDRLISLPVNLNRQIDNTKAREQLGWTPSDMSSPAGKCSSWSSRVDSTPFSSGPVIKRVH